MWIPKHAIGCHEWYRSEQTPRAYLQLLQAILTYSDYDLTGECMLYHTLDWAIGKPDWRVRKLLPAHL